MRERERERERERQRCRACCLQVIVGHARGVEDPVEHLGRAAELCVVAYLQHRGGVSAAEGGA